MNKLKDLKGLSGCRIELMDDQNGGYFVKKTSASLAYNNRLEKQIDKQKSFRHSDIYTPKIFETGYDKAGLFFCVMEYVHGVSFAKYLDLYPFNQSLKIFERLLKLVFTNFDSENSESYSPVLTKIEELESKLIGYETLLAYLKSNIPTQLCHFQVHGDLTFENILINQNDEIYFIDFLDSFLDSPYIDLGKINQELSLFWSLRHQMNTTSLQIKYQKLKTVFEEYCVEKNVLQKNLQYFSVLTLLRILPYTKDPSEISIINLNLEKWQKELQS